MLRWLDDRNKAVLLLFQAIITSSMENFNNGLVECDRSYSLLIPSSWEDELKPESSASTLMDCVMN